MKAIIKSASNDLVAFKITKFICSNFTLCCLFLILAINITGAYLIGPSPSIPPTAAEIAHRVECNCPITPYVQHDNWFPVISATIFTTIISCVAYILASINFEWNYTIRKYFKNTFDINQ